MSAVAAQAPRDGARPRRVLDVEHLDVRLGAHRPAARRLASPSSRGERVGLIGESGSGKSLTEPRR